MAADSLCVQRPCFPATSSHQLLFVFFGSEYKLGHKSMKLYVRFRTNLNELEAKEELLNYEPHFYSLRRTYCTPFGNVLRVERGARHDHLTTFFSPSLSGSPTHISLSLSLALRLLFSTNPHPLSPLVSFFPSLSSEFVRAEDA